MSPGPTNHTRTALNRRAATTHRGATTAGRLAAHRHSTHYLPCWGVPSRLLASVLLKHNGLPFANIEKRNSTLGDRLVENTKYATVSDGRHAHHPHTYRARPQGFQYPAKLQPSADPPPPPPSARRMAIRPPPSPPNRALLQGRRYSRRSRHGWPTHRLRRCPQRAWPYGRGYPPPSPQGRLPFTVVHVAVVVATFVVAPFSLHNSVNLATAVPMATLSNHPMAQCGSVLRDVAVLYSQRWGSLFPAMFLGRSRWNPLSGPGIGHTTGLWRHLPSRAGGVRVRQLRCRKAIRDQLGSGGEQSREPGEECAVMGVQGWGGVGHAVVRR